MNPFGWIKLGLSHRKKAMWLYRRGLVKAKLRDHKSAIADYTAVIDMADAPADVRAMALYNRSLQHSANHNESDAVVDLEMLLKMAGVAAQVRTEAKRKLVRMQRSSTRPDESSAISER